MNKTIATAALLLLAAAAVSSASGEDIGQVPVGPLAKDVEVGGFCRFSGECRSKCCVKVFPRGDQAGSPRQCRHFAEPGEPCSDEQIKGGVYVNGCPCRVGQCGRNGYCQ
ncbi:U-scoloptoxin(18)-Er1a-like [Dermacentor silvarum]|uniref:U-scoloptoxin(18)-Er1a-like n=1 Tax=Dermacentor silvarum TaxID=543639 RepID=UPI00189788DA|nr:U-scoloptoxin(18)-Er1a-like [Dermacentor silvarum]